MLGSQDSRKHAHQLFQTTQSILKKSDDRFSYPSDSIALIQRFPRNSMSLNQHKLILCWLSQTPRESKFQTRVYFLKCFFGEVLHI
jgi:hypothetical protein